MQNSSAATYHLPLPFTQRTLQPSLLRSLDIIKESTSRSLASTSPRSRMSHKYIITGCGRALFARKMI
eukprot:scaffold21692_cov80-Skeletonema_dohrnii-CCMP3373.AAC.1